MNNFNLENQYQLYLKRVALSEATMHEQQKIQLRQTFFGAIGQFLILLEKDIADLEENKAVEVLENFKTQISEYFLTLTQN